MNQKKQEKIVAIGGGVGPMAGVKLHEMIIENTRTNGTDQDHLDVFHLSRSHDLVDRTEYLLNQDLENPAEGMLRNVKILNKALELSGKELVLGVPCSTFHASDIFNAFLKKLKKENINNVEIVNMLEETVSYIKERTPNVKKIGLISTTGTRKFKVYNNFLEPHGFEIIEVPEKIQDELHDAIYNKDWGIKAKSPVSKKARRKFLKYVRLLHKQGVEVIVLGCTEIPLALPENKINGVLLVDPMLALARKLIYKSNKAKLKLKEASKEKFFYSIFLKDKIDSFVHCLNNLEKKFTFYENKK